MIRRLATLIDTLPTHWRGRRTANGPAAQSRPGVRFLDQGNTRVRLLQAGNRGPSLVFAADPPVPLELYDGLIAALQPSYRVTVLELPGFGCSLPRMGFRFSLESARDSVARVLDQLSGAPHTLVFPCVTGFIALALARTRPDLINALVLPQTPNWAGAQHWLQNRDPKGVLRTPVLGQIALALIRRKRAQNWYASALGDRSRAPEFACATIAHFDQGGCFCLASAFQDFLHDHHGLLAAVPQRTLIIAGGSDPSHRGTDFSATSELAPNSQLLKLGAVGHFPELEDSTRFVAELKQFLSPENHQ